MNKLGNRLFIRTPDVVEESLIKCCCVLTPYTSNLPARREAATIVEKRQSGHDT